MRAGFTSHNAIAQKLNERNVRTARGRSYGASGEGMAPSALFNGYRRSSPMSQHCHFDASRSLTALEQDSTIIAVIDEAAS
jgi:hypothetical protein